jgi:hypothetical protein
MLADGRRQSGKLRLLVDSKSIPRSRCVATEHASTTFDAEEDADSLRVSTVEEEEEMESCVCV